MRKRPDSGTIDEWMTSWLSEVADSMAPTTASNYAIVWKKHGEPFIGRKRLSTFAAEDVVAYYRRLREQGVSPATVAKVRVVLHRAFQIARQRGALFGDNPFGL